MGIAAEAFPLDGPLEGGFEGATVVIEPLEAGTARFPREFFEHTGGRLGAYRALLGGGGGDSFVEVPVPAFLVRHPTAGAILVDTGLHPSIATDPRDNMGRRGARYFSLERGHDVVSQLRDRNLTPGDIEVVILTHLHMDHASAISEFPESAFVLSAPEWEAATGARIPLMSGYHRAHFDHAVEYRLVDFDGELIDSYGPFGRTFDLFGDGSVRLAFTPGHSAGHCSVILRLPRRDFVVLGDVAYSWRQLQGGPEPLRPADRHNWRRSLHETQAFIKAYPYALAVPSHDAEFWKKLRSRYDE